VATSHPLRANHGAPCCSIDDDPAVIPAQVRSAFPAPKHQVDRLPQPRAAGLDPFASIPDIVLLDLRLPDGSASRCSEQIRSLDARIPVIFVTMTKTGRRRDRSHEARRV